MNAWDLHLTNDNGDKIIDFKQDGKAIKISVFIDGKEILTTIDDAGDISHLNHFFIIANKKINGV